MSTDQCRHLVWPGYSTGTQTCLTEEEEEQTLCYRCFFFLIFRIQTAFVSVLPPDVLCIQLGGENIFSAHLIFTKLHVNPLRSSCLLPLTIKHTFSCDLICIIGLKSRGSHVTPCSTLSPPSSLSFSLPHSGEWGKLEHCVSLLPCHPKTPVLIHRKSTTMALLSSSEVQHSGGSISSSASCLVSALRYPPSTSPCAKTAPQQQLLTLPRRFPMSNTRGKEWIFVILGHQRRWKLRLEDMHTVWESRCIISVPYRDVLRENQANEFLCLAARSWLRLLVPLLFFFFSSSAALSFPFLANCLSKRGNGDSAGKFGCVWVILCRCTKRIMYSCVYNACI